MLRRRVTVSVGPPVVDGLLRRREALASVVHTLFFWMGAFVCFPTFVILEKKEEVVQANSQPIRQAVSPSAVFI